MPWRTRKTNPSVVGGWPGLMVSKGWYALTFSFIHARADLLPQSFVQILGIGRNFVTASVRCFFSI